MVPIIYNVRSLTVRKTTTIATGLGIALVVFVLAGAMMLTNGLEKTLARSGDAKKAIIIRKGSDAELQSGIEEPKVGLILAQPGVAKDGAGQPLGVKELVMVVALDKIGTSGFSNVQVRGVPEGVMKFRPEVRIVTGRPARPGSDEVVIGKKLVGRFKGLNEGGTFELKKNRVVNVVGTFEAGGSSYESEVWADLETIRSSFGREGVVSSVRVQLEGESSYNAFELAVESDKQLGLEVMSETEYYAKQSEDTAKLIMILGIISTVLFSLGAMIGAMITMYAAVSNRTREIGTLRALGFSRGSVLFSFLVEAVILAMAGGALGILGALALGAIEVSLLNFESWSEIVFSFEPTVTIIVTALIGGVGMGLVGGLGPAIKASRVSPVQAMRG